MSLFRVTTVRCPEKNCGKEITGASEGNAKYLLKVHVMSKHGKLLRDRKIAVVKNE